METASTLSIMTKVDSVFYDFADLNLPSGLKIAVGIETGFLTASERDLFCLNDLRKKISLNIFEKLIANKDTKITAVSTFMNKNYGRLLLAKPNQDSFQLSNEDFKALEEHLRTRLAVW